MNLQEMEQVLKKLSPMDEKLDRIAKLLMNKGDASKQELIIKGVNVRRLHADCPYGYGLQLMDVLFTKEEMAGSLLLESKLSTKPGLDKEHVNKLFELIEDKFKDSKSYRKNWNPKVFILKANQKCRDSLKAVKIKDEDSDIDMRSDVDMLER